MLGLFKKKNDKKTEVKRPLNGELLELEHVPDEVFAGKMVGDGVAIKPSDGKLISPIDGEVVQIFPTKHAIGLRASNGVEVLIHIGIDTVKLGGEGFEAHVKTGDQVKVGDSLITFDLKVIEEKAKSTITPIVITNMDDIESIEKDQSNGAIMTVIKK